jgi:hypothetical protein
MAVINALTFEHVIIDSTTFAYVRAVGDVDGDGFPDIIAAKGNTGLTWYKYPNWDKYTLKSFNWRADDIHSADIDGDGDLDVVGVQDDDGKVYWYENPRPSGNPTNTWNSYYIGTSNAYVKDLEIADFNMDGKLDVVTRTSTTTSIFIQNTPTSWTKVKTLSHDSLDGLDVGDIDKDKDPDVVLNGFWFETPSDLINGVWAKHEIDTKWHNQNTGDWRDNNAKVYVADINNDEMIDVLISQSEKPGYPVSWYEASDPKNGPWTEHVIGYDDYSHTLQAGDMDNDGDTDVVVGKFERDDGAIPAPYPLKVYYNKNGDGLSWDVQEIDTLGIYTGVIGDIGRDGDLDIIGSRSYWKGPVEIRISKMSDNKFPLYQWTYIQVDNNMPPRIDHSGGPGYFFGLSMGDLTGDGYRDIVAHKMFYKNPGGNMQGVWQRVQFPWDWIDAFAIVNVDNDQYGDVTAEGEESSNNINIYWLEAQNIDGTSWSRTLIGSVPKTGHLWSQHYEVAQIVPGGKPEIIITGGDGVYYFKIPSNPAGGNWPRVKIIDNVVGYATGDINGDGYLDVAGGNWDTKQVIWWKNPGDGSGNWVGYPIGSVNQGPDRFAVADIDGDGRKDIVVSEEEYPVTQGVSSCFWFKAKPNPQESGWQRTTVISGAYSLNSMSAADMDRDGDKDIVLGEMGSQQRHMIFENDGSGNFGNPIVVGTEKESHLGARVADLDRDGDLDIVSIGWNEYQYVHVWRNDAGATTTCSPLNYPSDRWQRVWYIHSTGVCLGNRPDETSLIFDNNWVADTISYSRADDIEFSSSRTINLPTTGTYTFTVGSDDGVRFWIDDVLRIEKWYDIWYTTNSTNVYLAAGNHKLRLDFYENMGNARVSFNYSLSAAATCSDGTSYGQCSLTKPLYCGNGNLINKCSLCGCASGYDCQTDESCKLPSINLVGYWKFNESSGSTVNDHSGSGNTGTIYSASLSWTPLIGQLRGFLKVH